MTSLSHRSWHPAKKLAGETRGLQSAPADVAPLLPGDSAAGDVRRGPGLPKVSGLFRATLSSGDLGPTAYQRQDIDHLVSGVVGFSLIGYIICGFQSAFYFFINPVCALC
jgi:hypothetical protein